MTLAIQTSDASLKFLTINIATRLIAQLLPTSPNECCSFTSQNKTVARSYWRSETATSNGKSEMQEAVANIQCDISNDETSGLSAVFATLFQDKSQLCPLVHSILNLPYCTTSHTGRSRHLTNAPVTVDEVDKLIGTEQSILPPVGSSKRCVDIYCRV